LELHIRDASLADIPVIRGLTMQVWPQTYEPILGTEQVNYMLGRFYSPEALAQQMEEEGHKFIIGFDGERAIAFASYSETGPGIFKLHKLYILPDQQGKGTGRVMLGQVVNDLKARNGTELRLNVNRYNYLAISFYKKAGFTHCKEEDIDIGGGYFMNDHVLRMEINIKMWHTF
jgi:diamine N-acetyltransferase